MKITNGVNTFKVRRWVQVGRGALEIFVVSEQDEHGYCLVVADTVDGSELSECNIDVEFPKDMISADTGVCDMSKYELLPPANYKVVA